MLISKALSTVRRTAPLCTSASLCQKEVLEATEELTFEAEQRITEEERILKLRNKSRLRPSHLAMEKGLMKDIPDMPYFQTIHFRRRLLARFGENSGVNKGIAWPTKQDLESVTEYWSLAEEASPKELIEKAWRDNNAKKAAALEADREIQKKVANRDKEIQDFLTRQRKKNEMERKAKEEKEKLMAEVREHFGYDIDARSPEVKAMLEEKAKEQKKLIKEAKKKAKFEKATAFAALKAAQEISQQQTSDNVEQAVKKSENVEQSVNKSENV